VLIAVHPQHVRFYTQFLAFEQIADERPYPAVQNHSAVALSLDLKRLEIDRPANYDRFFTVPIDTEQLQFQPMSASERSHFLRVVEDPNTFEQYVRERPVKSVLIAAGIGLLFLRFWMRR
jgi:hypothetical protein